MAKQIAVVEYPGKIGSCGEYICYYMFVEQITQAMLAVRSRLPQPLISKIIHGRIANISVDVLVCICLALRLTLEKSIDLLARAERAFSPASSTHAVYAEIIEIYADKSKNFPSNYTMLEGADNYLREKNEPTLPNYSYVK